MILMPNANRDKGLWFERRCARYFREHGMGGADRRVATGWRNAQRESADLGDLRDVPGICVQAKYVADSHPRGLAGKALDDAMADTLAQCEASGEALPLLVEKRKGHADIGKSWAHLPANYYCALQFGIDPTHQRWSGITYPVRVELYRIIDRLAEFSAACSQEAA